LNGVALDEAVRQTDGQTHSALLPLLLLLQPR
jgi:hypothetical protein